MSFYRKMAHWVLAILFVGTFGGALLNTAVPDTASAACAGNFIGFPAWYDGVTGPDCNVVVDSGGLSPFIWRIAMNIVEILLVALGYIAAFFIIYGGVLFITSNGKPDKAILARKTILDAVVGLAIAMTSIAIVNFISGSII
jgi:hypothetical protein